MKNLIDKYRKDELTTAELSMLREKASAMTDAEIEEQISGSWFNDDIDTSSVKDELIDKKKKDIYSVIDRKQTGLPVFIRWAQIAAAILLPVSILFSLYFYRENHRIMSEEMFVTTGRAERASITLPDGSTVSLNSESRLGYFPKSYNKRKREISFSGEGYFQIFPDESIPFFVNAKGLQVKVLGTTFNLSVRENESTAQLALEEGKVLLVSTLNNKNAVLQKNQKAILEYATGDITVITDANIRDASAWKRDEMIFRNTELAEIIRRIEENYHVTIKTNPNCKDYLDDPFTGTLPADDLNEALKIIEYSYHLKTTINGKEITIEATKN